jgi:primosomal protein N' (replication factor Y)
MYVSVAVDTKSPFEEGLYTYELPEHLAGEDLVGRVAIVPFGSRIVAGIVWAVLEHSDVEAPRPLLDISPPHLRVDPDVLGLAGWICRRYGGDAAGALSHALPLSEIAAPDRALRLGPRAGEADVELAPAVEHLRKVGRSVRLETLRRRFAALTREAVTRAIRTGALIETVALSWPGPPEDAVEPEYRAPRRPSAAGAARAVYDAAVRHISTRPNDPLLVRMPGYDRVALLAPVLDLLAGPGGQILWLVPGVAQAGVRAEQLAGLFGETVARYRSDAGIGERLAGWAELRSRARRLLVGTRGAVFEPLPRMALVVIEDEEDEGYRERRHPRHWARDAALERARMRRCPALVVSDTPTVDGWAAAAKERWGAVSVPRPRALQAQIVDLRHESQPGAVISEALAERTRRALRSRGQVVLYQNRLGSGRVICRECGYAPRCPECGWWMVYYREDRVFRCHKCGATLDGFTECPGCGGPHMRYISPGTRAVAAEAQRLFPHTYVRRIDSEQVESADDAGDPVAEFAAGGPGIVVGTRAVAKAIPLPRVRLLGIISLEAMSEVGHFRAGERAWQTIARLVAAMPGLRTIVAQTYEPDHPICAALARGEWDALYEDEVAAREELGYPPFGRVLTVTLSDAATAATLAGVLGSASGVAAGVVAVLGGAAEPGGQRWRLVAKIAPGADAQGVVQLIGASLPAQVRRSASVEFDP